MLDQSSLHNSCRARGAEEGVGGGVSFFAAPWGRTLSEHVFLGFRRGRKSLGLGRDALQAAPTASALHLLHPPPPFPGSCGRCNTRRLHLPACLVSFTQDFRLLGLLGVVVQVSSLEEDGWEGAM